MTRLVIGLNREFELCLGKIRLIRNFKNIWVRAAVAELIGGRLVCRSRKCSKRFYECLQILNIAKSGSLLGSR